MSRVLRLLGGIVTGLLLAIVLLAALEFFSAIIHPCPEGRVVNIQEHVARYPAAS